MLLTCWPSVQYQLLFLLITKKIYIYNVQWQQYASKHETFWTGLQKQPLSLRWCPFLWSGGKWILSLKYLICRICSQRWTITVEAWEGPKAWWTNEENGVCVGYFVSVTPGVTLQSIQCQSNCEDKTGRANQCSGPLKQPRAMKEPLYSTGRTPLMRNYSHACEPGLTAIKVSHADESWCGFQIKSSHLTCP